MAPPTHNPDDEMSLVDEDLQLDGEELHLDELPTITLAPSPAADETRRQKRPPSPTAPLASASQGAGIVLTAHAPAPAPTRNLRRPRPGPVMPRRRLAVVSLLMPEAGADAIRADLIARITAMLKPHFFRRGSVPEFEVATGKALRVPRRAYARLCFSWPTEEEAEDFKRLLPRSISLNSSRSVLLKVFEDRNPGFTAAKAGGAATLSLRNIPPGYTPEDVRDFLLNGADPSEPGWLADLQFFHRTTDPYEEVFLPVFTGIPLPLPDDPSFSRIPAVIPFEDGSPPALLNVSTHVCAFCGNKHRDSDHETFAFKREQRLNNKAHISVAQLQQTNGTPFCPALPFPFSPTHLLVCCCPPLSVSLASSLAIVSFPLATLLCSAIDMLRPFDPLLAIFCPCTAPPCPLPPFPPLLSRTSIPWSLLAFPLFPTLSPPSHVLAFPCSPTMGSIHKPLLYNPPLPPPGPPPLYLTALRLHGFTVSPSLRPSSLDLPLRCLPFPAPFSLHFPHGPAPSLYTRNSSPSLPPSLVITFWPLDLACFPPVPPTALSSHASPSPPPLRNQAASDSSTAALPDRPLFPHSPNTPLPRPTAPLCHLCPRLSLTQGTPALLLWLNSLLFPLRVCPVFLPPCFPHGGLLAAHASAHGHSYLHRQNFSPLCLPPFSLSPPCSPPAISPAPHPYRPSSSQAHTSNLRAAAKGPAAKEKYSNWRALTFLDIPQIGSFLSQ
ncbi:unnamed protein product [Closterium sp. Naga37s-1]|nr:unnamed protein product [Closterium sp. Naga37s-1]